MTNSTDSLWKFNASDLISMLHKKEISPKEVLDSSINRISKVNSSINAVVTLCIERAKKKIEETAEEKNTIPYLLQASICPPKQLLNHDENKCDTTITRVFSCWVQAACH